METGPKLKVYSDRLVKPGIEPAIPGLQGKRFIHYTTAAPVLGIKQVLVPRLYVFMLNSAEHEISTAHKKYNATK